MQCCENSNSLSLNQSGLTHSPYWGEVRVEIFLVSILSHLHARVEGVGVICVQVINTNRDEEIRMEGLGVNTSASATTPTLVMVNILLSPSLPWVWNLWTYSAGDTKKNIYTLDVTFFFLFPLWYPVIIWSINLYLYPFWDQISILIILLPNILVYW